MSKETILICEPHPDDAVVSMAGTILKYKEEGKKIIKVVFSKGQSSHPHLKEEVIAKARKKEIEITDEILKIKETIFFELTDTRLSAEIEEKNIKSRLKELIEKYKPSKIFIPTSLDLHPDHRAVNKAVLDIINTTVNKSEVYAFEVWNISKRSVPKLYIDITPYFSKKIKIMKKFKSQWFSMYLLLIPVYLRARLNGKKINVKYAERFFKLR